jgi:hypothetical protein
LGQPEPKETTWQWTPARERAALLLAEGMTWAVIDKEHGISRASLARWVKIPEFQARIDEHIEDIMDEARRVIRRNAGRAAIRMVLIMDHGNPRDSVKLAAAKDLLDRSGFKAAEKHEVSGRNGADLVIHVRYDDDNPTD